MTDKQAAALLGMSLFGVFVTLSMFRFTFRLIDRRHSHLRALDQPSPRDEGQLVEEKAV